MADNFQASKVAASELSSSTKFNNFVQAVEDAINSLDNANIAAAAAIAVSKLAAGTEGYKIQTVAGVPTWVVDSAALTYQTTLPGAPTNGQETILVDSTSAPTYAWRLRYNSTLAKWEYIGGQSAFSEVTTAEATATTLNAYLALATAGPSIVIPVAGDYKVEIGCRLALTGGSSLAYMSYDIGGTGAVDADSIRLDIPQTGGMNAMRVRVKTLTAVTLTAKYKSVSAHNTYEQRWMRVQPVKL